jgi:hypothetical protein
MFKLLGLSIDFWVIVTGCTILWFELMLLIKTGVIEVE